MELHEPESLSNAGLEKFEQEVHAWSVLPAETEGYEKAEVTAGGVDTDELSSKTMESRKVSGLFFIGEVVDFYWRGGGRDGTSRWIQFSVGVGFGSGGGAGDVTGSEKEHRVRRGSRRRKRRQG